MGLGGEPSLVSTDCFALEAAWEWSTERVRGLFYDFPCLISLLLFSGYFFYSGGEQHGSNNPEKLVYATMKHTM